MALAYIPASTTSLIFYIYPLATTLLAMLVFKLRPGRIIWLAMGLIGLGCGLIFHDAFAQALDIRGIFYALACMAFFSLYLTLIQVFTRTDEARRLSPWVIMCMALVFTILSPPTRVMDYGLEGLAVALGLGFIPTALAVTLLYKAVSEIGSAYAAIFSSIEPAATVLLASLVLGEAVAWPQLAGMSAIILGIVLPNLRLARQHARMRDKG